MWRAADEMLDRPVAVKEMRIDGLDAEDTRTRRERTLREARATARIDHPNVVRVYDVVDEGERLWIVMELVAGRSLERIVAEDGPLGPREAALLGLGLVAALRQVHERGVLHRDIKPGNVLVESGARRIVLTDFGIAAIQDAKALTMVGMLVGSPDYMAPERISGRPQGPPSDVWSLGATLCAALDGRSPFSRDTTLATLHAVLYEEPALPATAGPLRDILSALLEKDPAVRPGLNDLETALHPVAFPPPTPTVTMPVGGGPALPPPPANPQLPQTLGREQAPPSQRPNTHVDHPAQPGPEQAQAPERAWRDGAEGEKVPERARQQGPEGGEDPKQVRQQGPEGGEEPEAARRDGAVEVPDGLGTPAGTPPPGPEAAAEAAARPGAAETSEPPEPADHPEAPQPTQEPEAATAPTTANDTTTPPPPPPTTDPRRPAPPSPPAPQHPTHNLRRPTSLETPVEGVGAGTSGPAAEPAASAEAPVEEARVRTPGVGPVPGAVEDLRGGTRVGAADPAASAVVPVEGAGAGASGALEDPRASGEVRIENAGAGTSAGPEASPGAAAEDSRGDAPGVGAGSAAVQGVGGDVPAAAAGPPASPERAVETARVGSSASDCADVPAEGSRSGAPAATAPDVPVQGGPPALPAPAAATTPTQDAQHRTSNASTELASRTWSEVRSETPVRGIVQGSPRAVGVSLVRARTETVRRPEAGPGVGADAQAGAMPPGERPGPAIPARHPRSGGRRARLAAVVGAVVAGGVLAVVLVANAGSPGGNRAGGTSPSPSYSASYSASPTVEGTSRPQSLPPGTHREAGGFAWATPDGWRRDVKTGAEVHYTSPDGRQELVAKSSIARGDLMETWETSEQNARQGQGYRKIRLEETTFRGHPAVVWEYTFTLKGVHWHARLLGFNQNGKSFQVNTWYQPEMEGQALKTYEKVKDSFVVL
ncbi:protein kinase domain-containing protein [Streptomyces sp. TRM68416]|uniref:protein kinase domain-containing protein n=1 Tax=Streptomyces sp. TRM68416 TaxID=2758412 RepID=UPI00397FD794